MRVIAGSAGGLHLQPPPEPTRPTMDKVKAAIFSSLGDWVLGAKVLDLFSGSGSMGIEALSRGAASATLVENNSSCITCIRKNLRHCHLEASVQQMDVFRFLDVYCEPGCWDIIFADPPYHKLPEHRDYSSELLANPALAKGLTENGVFVLERAPSKGRTVPENWTLLRQRTYGKTEVLFLKAVTL